jgi:hypothetical protein
MSKALDDEVDRLTQTQWSAVRFGAFRGGWRGDGLLWVSCKYPDKPIDVMKIWKLDCTACGNLRVQKERR